MAGDRCRAARARLIGLISDRRKVTVTADGCFPAQAAAAGDEQQRSQGDDAAEKHRKSAVTVLHGQLLALYSDRSSRNEPDMAFWQISNAPEPHRFGSPELRGARAGMSSLRRVSERHAG